MARPGHPPGHLRKPQSRIDPLPRGSVACERALLGAVLETSMAHLYWPLVADLAVADFGDPDCRIVRELVDLLPRRPEGDVSAVALAAAGAGLLTLGLVAEILNESCVSVREARYCATVIRRESLRRRLRRAVDARDPVAAVRSVLSRAAPTPSLLK